MTDNSIIPPNRLKQTIKAGKPAVGTMLSEIRQPAVIQLLVNAGFDFVIIDNEHGPFNIETIADLSRTARYLGLTPVVRIPDLAYPYIAQSLDAGAQGIMVPRITHPDQVREAVQIMKYPPLGRRGAAGSRGHTNFQAGAVAEMLTSANEESLLIAQVETKEAVEAIDEIVTIEGVDVALVGPGDLSISLGVPGQMDAPVMQEAIAATIAACQKHGVAPALHINDVGLASYWAKQGMQILSANSEAGLLVQAGLQLTSALGEALGKD